MVRLYPTDFGIAVDHLSLERWAAKVLGEEHGCGIDTAESLVKTPVKPTDDCPY